MFAYQPSQCSTEHVTRNAHEISVESTVVSHKTGARVATGVAYLVSRKTGARVTTDFWSAVRQGARDTTDADGDEAGASADFFAQTQQCGQQL